MWFRCSSAIPLRSSHFLVDRLGDVFRQLPGQESQSALNLFRMFVQEQPFGHDFVGRAVVVGLRRLGHGQVPQCGKLSSFSGSTTSLKAGCDNRLNLG